METMYSNRMEPRRIRLTNRESGSEITSQVSVISISGHQFIQFEPIRLRNLGRHGEQGLCDPLPQFGLLQVLRGQGVEQLVRRVRGQDLQELQG